MSIIDPLETNSKGSTDPVDSALAITPSNISDLPVLGRAITVINGGTIKATFTNGETINFEAVAGQFIPARVTRIWADETTATGISILW